MTTGVDPNKKRESPSGIPASTRCLIRVYLTDRKDEQSYGRYPWRASQLP